MKKRFLNGYIVVYVPNHFNTMDSDNWKGWQYEHRYIVELYIQRPLSNEECVHHINGDKQDNSIENLMIVSNHEHALLHSLGNKGNSKKIIECKVCGNTFSGYKHKSKYCSLKCLGISNRKTEKPDKEYLKKLIVTKSFTDIGKMFGVSDNAVRKWCKSYGLPYRKKDLKIIK